MVQLFEFELTKAAEVLVREVFKLKRGETFVITCDTESDARVANAAAGAAHAVGAKPMVVWIPTPPGPGRAADPALPAESLTGALMGADAWLELNYQYIVYSALGETVLKENKKVRQFSAVGMYVDMMVRMVGNVDYPALEAYVKKLAAMTKAATRVKVTSPAGTDMTVENDPKRPILCMAGYADDPGFHPMGGQIGWSPIYESINGVIVFDGSIQHPIGLLKEPVKLHVKNGAVVKIEGGSQAAEFEAWLKSFHDPQMLRIAHGPTYGCHPGAKLTGFNIAEDERVWGCTEWGLGYVSPALVPPDGITAASHTDGICLNCSVWLDDQQIWEKGKPIHPELAKLAKKLGK